MPETETDWVAWIEKGPVLWHWTVERSASWWANPRAGLPTRGDSLRGVALTRERAQRKARKWLANRIGWAAPQPDRREYVSAARRLEETTTEERSEP